MRCKLRPARSLLFVLLLSAAGPAWAALALSLGELQGDGWAVRGLRLELTGAPDADYRLALTAQDLTLPGGLGQWQALRLRCEALRRDGPGYRCAALQAEADTPQGHQRLRGSLSFVDAEHWSVRLNGVRLAGGRWQLQASADGPWRAILQASDAKPAGLLALWPGHGLPDWGWGGRLAARAELRGQGSQPSRATVSLTLADGAWSSADGLQAGQALGGQLRLEASRRADGWQGRLSGEWSAGQVYSDPLYLAFDKHPLELATEGRWRSVGVLELDGLRGGLGELLRVEGAVRVPLAKPATMDGRLNIELADLGLAYPVLLQPFGFGGVLGGLQTAGRAGLALTLEQGRPAAAALTLSDVRLEDGAGRFGLDALAGSLHWRATGAAPVSRLRWQGGHLYRVMLGASGAELLLSGDTITLTEALALPLLDGELRLPQLSATGLAGPSPAWRAALEARALSLPLLSRALGWPALAGDLSVEIPAVHYADGVLALDGELRARAFDGSVRVSGLQLQQPLSPAPLFQAEASLQGLDLERLTRVFDLGRITGRLEGEVRNLQLVGWSPVAFDAVLRTPPKDDLPHRISQRAVENLTALGNNGAAALSGTFLRVFDSFSYDRLMLEVHLQGQRARLDGIAHPGGGYYLVKGAGLPRIDVIGRNRDVAWRDLLERLKRIQLKGAQVR